jgi:hypothetical protein
MAETAQSKCPSCGSSEVVQASLWLTEAKYFECRRCKVTFRQPAIGARPPNPDRFNEALKVPPEKPKK